VHVFVPEKKRTGTNSGKGQASALVSCPDISARTRLTCWMKVLLAGFSPEQTLLILRAWCGGIRSRKTNRDE
jgi:hypothetical protein